MNIAPPEPTFATLSLKVQFVASKLPVVEEVDRVAEYVKKQAEKYPME